MVEAMKLGVARKPPAELLLISVNPLPSAAQAVRFTTQTHHEGPG
jgi:hypothetical protein